MIFAGAENVDFQSLEVTRKRERASIHDARRADSGELRNGLPERIHLSREPYMRSYFQTRKRKGT